MASLQGPIICPTVRAKQAGCCSVPVSPVVKARLLKTEFWGFKGLTGSIGKVRTFPHRLNTRKFTRVHCTFSSSSDGDGKMAENFSENDEDYVNSSVIEAGMQT